MDRRALLRVATMGGLGLAGVGAGMLSASPASATWGWQSNWRWCRKCRVMFYPASGPTLCPQDGGAHDGSWSWNYSIEYVTDYSEIIPRGGQDDGWRWCQKCKCLFGWDKLEGICAFGGSHDPGVSFYYSVPFGPTGTIYQTNWLLCISCGLMYYGPHQAESSCAGGGTHIGAYINVYSFQYKA